MPFYSEATDINEELRSSISQTLKNLRELEEVNNTLIANTKADLKGGLKKLLDIGSIPQEIYSQQMEQLKKELDFRLQAEKQISQDIRRYKKILDKKNVLINFVLPASIGKEELKRLKEIAESSIQRSEDEDEKALLRAILPSLETHKNMMDAGKEPPTKTIPLIENEQQYLFLLLRKLNDTDLDTTTAYLMQLDELKKFRNQSSVKSLSSKESKTIDKLLNLLTRETELALMLLTVPNFKLEEIRENYRFKVENYLDDATKQAKELKGLKSFVNKLCELVGIKPIFSSEKDITDSLKAGFFYTHPKNSDQNEPEVDMIADQNL